MVGRWLAPYYMNASNFEKHIGTYQIELQHGAVVLVLRQPWASIRERYGRAQGTTHSTTETQAGRKGSQWEHALPDSKSVGRHQTTSRRHQTTSPSIKSQASYLAMSDGRAEKQSLMPARGQGWQPCRTPPAPAMLHHDQNKKLMPACGLCTTKDKQSLMPAPGLCATKKNNP